MQLPTRPTSNKYVIGVNSPYYVSVNSNQPGYTYSSNWTTAELYIDVWSGSLTSSYYLSGPGGTNTLLPIQTLKKDKVSSTDVEVIFEISDYIRPYIIPTYTGYDYTSATAGYGNEAVWFQVRALLYDYGLTSSGTASVFSYYTSVVENGGGNTQVANLGWKWNNQQYDYYSPNTSSFGGTVSFEPLMNYSEGIRYTTRTLNLNAYNTNDLISRSEYTPTKKLCNKQSPYLIVYINKDGWWESFSPFGKVVVNSKIEREKYNYSLRNPLNYDSSQNHLVKILDVSDTHVFTINTGLVNEKVGAKVEEMLVSPKVYLLQFSGTSVGGYYSDYIQIPVIITNSDFTRRTRYNDKMKTSYNIVLEETVSKIDNVK